MIRTIIRSIFPDPYATSPPGRFLLKSLVLHFRPKRVPSKTLRFSLTWGLGGMAATLIFLQFGTGLLLKFAYIPTPAAAYDSVRWIATGIPFGGLIRNLHYWCSHLLVAVAFLHLLRVFFTSAFHPPRQFNWVIGLCLLGTILLANFTGYLLPWDQLAFWAVTVSTGMLEYFPIVGRHLQALILEDNLVGPATLQLFYNLHTALVPVLLLGLMLFHFWRVRKAKGLVIPRLPGQPPETNPEMVDSIPDLLLREVVVALVLCAAVLVLAAGFNAGLAGPANPGLSPNPTRAPWYFAGLQELLLHLHPVLAVCVIPLLTVGALLLIPYITYPIDSRGIWFVSRNGRKTGAIALVTGSLLTPLLIVLDEQLWSAAAHSLGLAPLVGSGLIPMAALAGLFAVFLLVMRWRFQVNRNEAVQAVFILLISAYGVLTFTGVWLRGAGMELVMPW